MPDDIKLPDIMLMVRALEHTQKPARPIALEMIERGIEAYARAAVRALEVENHALRQQVAALSREAYTWSKALEAALVQREPLTDEQIKDLCLKAGSEASPDVPLYVVVSRAVEAAHGIPAPNGGA